MDLFESLLVVFTIVIMEKDHIALITRLGLNICKVKARICSLRIKIKGIELKCTAVYFEQDPLVINLEIFTEIVSEIFILFFNIFHIENITYYGKLCTVQSVTASGITD